MVLIMACPRAPTINIQELSGGVCQSKLLKKEIVAINNTKVEAETLVGRTVRMLIKADFKNPWFSKAMTWGVKTSGNRSDMAATNRIIYAIIPKNGIAVINKLTINSPGKRKKMATIKLAIERARTER